MEKEYATTLLDHTFGVSSPRYTIVSEMWTLGAMAARLADCVHRRRFGRDEAVVRRYNALADELSRNYRGYKDHERPLLLNYISKPFWDALPTWVPADILSEALNELDEWVRDKAVDVYLVASGTPPGLDTCTVVAGLASIRRTTTPGIDWSCGGQLLSRANGIVRDAESDNTKRVDSGEIASLRSRVK